jgi:UDP-3-O-[3-hydroxymyristoyl] glucosamine N-acyltransferase
LDACRVIFPIERRLVVSFGLTPSMSAVVGISATVAIIGYWERNPMPAYTVEELSRLVSGRVLGDPNVSVTGAATLREAVAGQITFIDDAKRLLELRACSASAVVVPRGVVCDDRPCIEVESVHAAFAAIHGAFAPVRPLPRPGVSPAAHVDPTATIGANVQIHPGVYVGPRCEIAHDAILHPNVVLLGDCHVGPQTVIFPNVVLYEGTVVGARCLIHAGASIGAYGFGYSTKQGKHVLSAQLGNVVLEDDVEIGACSTVDRGTYGSTLIGAGSKIDNQVQIAHNVRIGRGNIICSQVGIAGSSSTGDYVVLAGQAGVKDHVHLGHRVTVGAQSGVMTDVPDQAVYVGSPARPEREHMQMLAASLRLPEMRKEFKRLLRELQAAQACEVAASSREAA